MDVDRPRELSAEALGVLKEGIDLVLSRWWALQTALNQGGGPHSRHMADQLASDIASWFSQSREPLYIDDLENMLEEALDSLGTFTEDSIVEETQVAEKLMIMHEEWLEGNFKSIESLRKVSVPHVRQVVNDDSSNMMLDAPESLSNSSSIDMPDNEPRPKVATEAEDGWVQVERRRNRGKRN